MSRSENLSVAPMEFLHRWRRPRNRGDNSGLVRQYFNPKEIAIEGFDR